MSDFYLVDPQGWEYDLQSVYSAYMGYFQLHAISWYDQSWGQFFETFQQFLAFSWPVVTVTDTRTGRAHIVTRRSSITAFVKMIKTRFGETLPEVENMLLVKPLETSQRHMRHVNDWSTYKKLHATLPAVALAVFKARVRAGDPAAIRELWATRDKTFLALDFECLCFEKNGNNNSINNGNGDGGHRSPSSSYVTVTEWGYAVIRSSHLAAAGAWPPVPDKNYRKGHYVVSERATSNSPSDGNEKAKPPPSVSWQYAFGDSQVVSKAKLTCIIRCILSSLLSPDSESVANNVVLVGHGVHMVLQRLEEMKISVPFRSTTCAPSVTPSHENFRLSSSPFTPCALREPLTAEFQTPIQTIIGEPLTQPELPSNVFVLDVAYLERVLYNTGERGQMVSRKTGAARMPESLLTLGGVLHALGIPLPSSGCALHNAGNDAFMTLVAFQRMAAARGGVGVGGEVVAVGTAPRAGTGTGVKDANASAQGRGHVSRAATVAARFFRTGNGTKDITALPQAQDQTQNQKGRVRPQSWVSVSGADEMGMAVHPPSSKRASMMSARTTMTTATTMTTKTMVTAKPVVTVKPAVTAKPVVTVKPVMTVKPVTVEPVVMVKPVTVEPVVTTKPVMTAKTPKASKTLLPRLRWRETGADEKVNENEKESKKVKQNGHDNGHDNEKASTNGSGSGSGAGNGVQSPGWWIPPLPMSASMSMSPPSSLRVNGPGGHQHQRQLQGTFVEMQRV